MPKRKANSGKGKKKPSGGEGGGGGRSQVLTGASRLLACSLALLLARLRACVLDCLAPCLTFYRVLGKIRWLEHLTSKRATRPTGGVPTSALRPKGCLPGIVTDRSFGVRHVLFALTC